jgi:hypothetical protein
MTDTRKPVESLLTDYDIFEPSCIRDTARFVNRNVRLRVQNAMRVRGYLRVMKTLLH